MDAQTPEEIESELSDLVDDLDLVLDDAHPALVLGALGVVATTAFACLAPNERMQMLMSFIHTLTGEVLKGFEGDDEELH